MTLSTEAHALFERARHIEHAADLYLGDARLEPARLVEILGSPVPLDDRALWNLLFAAGELSQRVDVYRAHELFTAVCALVARTNDGEPERAAILEMAFDFFFARKTHPLIPLRAKEIVTSLGGLLEGTRIARRTAIHGLGHLIALGRDQAWAKDAVALLDPIAMNDSDAELRRYAEEARTGTLA